LTTEPVRVRAPQVLDGVKVLHFGHFDPAYSRNRIIAKALRRAGASVRIVSQTGPFASRAPRLLRTMHPSDADVVLVGFPGHADVPLARLASAPRRTPVIFDAFVSLSESAEDRGRVRPGTLAAWRYQLEDRLACRCATRTLLDTNAHATYFAESVGVPWSRLRRVWVGADDEVIQPGPTPDDSVFRVFVYASFIPLHGLQHVVRAAHLIEQEHDDIRVEIVGGGDTEADIRRLASELDVGNVRFLGRRPYEELADMMAASHVCLGIFGTSGKAQRVIPNKVFDALAAARAVITADTPAAREALIHADTAWLCPAGDPRALADSILALRSSEETRARIARSGHALFEQKFCLDAISADVGPIVLEVL
jgi:glycosyltransferase involved in cell wall biosynthesis